MLISVCPDCYDADILSEGHYIKTEAKDGEVYDYFKCPTCYKPFEEKI
jgi:hypothetical protein